MHLCFAFLLATLGTLVGCASTSSSLSVKPNEPRLAAGVQSSHSDTFSSGRADWARKYPRGEDYVVRIVTGRVTCTGTLIDQQRVLTAHHCVAERNAHNEIMNRDVRAASITVELGGDALPWGEVGVSAIVAPRCGYRAGPGDLAILVLSRRLVGMDAARTDVDRTPVVGETVEPVGFGRCSLSSDALARARRPGGAIAEVTPDHFRALAGICPGDSGGPVLAPDRRVIGLISRSAMDGDEHTLGESEFTRLDRWRQVFSNSADLVLGKPAAELPAIDCEVPPTLP